MKSQRSDLLHFLNMCSRGRMMKSGASSSLAERWTSRRDGEDVMDGVMRKHAENSDRKS